MGKERDWMDYAQLGLSAVQTARMSEMASELGRLAEAAEAKERQAERVRRLRRAILITGELLDSLEADSSGTESSLSKQFVILHETEEMLTRAGVLPPTEFDDWEDMERASKLGKRIDALRDRLLKTMTDGQRRDAERCVAYMAEEKDLRNLIMVYSENELLEQSKKRFAEIEAELKAKVGASRRTRAVRGAEKMGCGLLVVSIPLMFLCAFILPKGDISKGIVLFLLVGMFLGCALFLGQFFLRAASGEKVIPAEIRKLEGELGELEERIEETEHKDGTTVGKKAAIVLGDTIDVKALKQQFGGVESADKLRTIYIERRDFVRGIIGPQYLAKPDNDEGDRAVTED